MGAHSLLEDMYGNGWVSGTVSACRGGHGFAQLINIKVRAAFQRPTLPGVAGAC